MRYLRAALPTIICSRSSKATTEGTRFRPSSPGMTTGFSDSMKATREFVVPRSMPMMRSEPICNFVIGNLLIVGFNCKIPRLPNYKILLLSHRFVDVADQVPDVISAVQQV